MTTQNRCENPLPLGSNAQRPRCEESPSRSATGLGREVPVRVTGAVVGFRAGYGLGDLGQVAVHLQLRLLVRLARSWLARVLVVGGRIRRFHLRSPFKRYWRDPEASNSSQAAAARRATRKSSSAWTSPCRGSHSAIDPAMVPGGAIRPRGRA